MEDKGKRGADFQVQAGVQVPDSGAAPALDASANVPGAILPVQKRCKGISKSGRPCRNLASRGTDYCWFHDPAIAEERSRAGRKGWEISQHHALKDASLGRIKNPRSASDVCRELARTASDVKLGHTSPAAGRTIIDGLLGIAKIYQDQAIVSELKALNEALQDRGAGAEKLLALLDVQGGGHE